MKEGAANPSYGVSSIISSQQGNQFSKNNVTFCQSSDQLRKSLS